MDMATVSAEQSGTFPIGGDLPVHRLGFGAMRVVGEGVWGPPDNRQAMIELLRRVPALGIDFIDTADSYGPFLSEEMIAEALHPYPEGLVIATKAGLLRSGPGDWEPDGRPEHLRQRCEGSLERLKVERIDLFQLHRIDPDVPEADQFGTLRELQEEGKIRHIGLSGASVEQIERAREVLTIVSVQNKYNLVERKWDDVVDYCEREGIAFIPWYPLNAGPLTERDGPLGDLVARIDATPAQIALAWLLQRSPVMIPIPGTSSIEHLNENTAAASLRLDSDAIARLDAIA
jgi:aryl-alcohol dehydrogenase-like predicted oxidoreductase